MYGYDSAATGAAPVNGPTTGEVAWSATGVGAQYIAEDAILAGNKAINFDGSMKWELTLDGATGIGPAGIRSDGSIYYYNGGLGKVYLVNPNLGTIDNAGNLNGALQWTLSVLPGIGGGILDASGNLLLRVGEGYSNVYKITSSGALEWTFPIPDGSFEPPAVSLVDGTIYIGAEDSYLYAIRPDGSQKWRFRASDHVHTSPTVDAQGNIYVSSRDFTFYKLSASGKVLWKTSAKGPPLRGGSQPWNDGGVALDSARRTSVFLGYNGIYAYNMDTGVLNWKYTDTITQSPLTHPAIDASGRIYFVDNKTDRVIALNSSGSKLWEGPAPAPTLWANSPILGADGTLYVGDGYIVAYHNGGIGRPTITDLDTSADPVAAGAAFTLTAAEVFDLQGTIAAVDFYRDANGNGVLDVGTDEHLGPTYPSPVYNYTYHVDVTAPLATGPAVYFAQATDNDGHVSNVVRRTVDVVAADAAVQETQSPADYDAAAAAWLSDVELPAKRKTRGLSGAGG